MRSLLLLLLCLSFLSCSVKRVNSPFVPIADGLELSVKKILSHKTYNDGAINIAGKGGRFKRVMYRVKNTSDKDIAIDFDLVRLMNSRGTDYKPCFVFQNAKVTIVDQGEGHVLKAGKTRSFVAQYCEPFRKEEILSKVMVYDTIIRF
ncbi:MAG: hypothetical protein EOO45_08905 [Flavobacterium sp.]|nr:MAG: hypothetical protein EOO45_08905 [Flavobacterium sp.]